jgi:hypothetical protein
MKSKDKNKNADNIFKYISRNDPCYYLNKTLLPNFYPHDCFYQMNENKYLVKYFNNHDLYKWELYVYNRLIKHNITPSFIDYGKSEYSNMSAIAVDISNMMTFREVLCISKEEDKRILINELFSFINKLKNIGILHNNLTIDSIYIKENQFYMIEFTNMKIKIKKKESKQKSEKDHDDNSNIDIFSLYLSIASDNKNNNNIINYIKTKCKFDSHHEFIYKITDYYT